MWFSEIVKICLHVLLYCFALCRSYLATNCGRRRLSPIKRCGLLNERGLDFPPSPRKSGTPFYNFLNPLLLLRTPTTRCCFHPKQQQSLRTVWGQAGTPTPRCCFRCGGWKYCISFTGNLTFSIQCSPYYIGIICWTKNYKCYRLLPGTTKIELSPAQKFRGVASLVRVPYLNRIVSL